MCDPLTLTAISTGVAAIGQGISAYSAHQQGVYEARVARQNARFEQDRARDAQERGLEEARRYQRQLGQEMGAQNAALAANGIDITFGSAFDIRGDTAVAGREDVQTIYRNTEREVQGFDVSSANFRAEAKAAKRRATGALVQGAFGIGSTVLGGAQQYRRIQWNQRNGLNPYG